VRASRYDFSTGVFCCGLALIRPLATTSARQVMVSFLIMPWSVGVCEVAVPRLWYSRDHVRDRRGRNRPRTDTDKHGSRKRDHGSRKNHGSRKKLRIKKESRI